MLNLIVFIGDKAQVNYMDGYTIKLSLCEKDVRMWIQKSLSMIGHTQSLRMSIYCNCLLSPGGAITANWSVGYFCLCCFWFFSRPRRKAKLWKQGAEVKSTDQWNLFIAATVFFFFFKSVILLFSHWCYKLIFYWCFFFSVCCWSSEGLHPNTSAYTNTYAKNHKQSTLNPA